MKKKKNVYTSKQVTDVFVLNVDREGFKFWSLTTFIFHRYEVDETSPEDNFDETFDYSILSKLNKMKPTQKTSLWAWFTPRSDFLWTNWKAMMKLMNTGCLVVYMNMNIFLWSNSKNCITHSICNPEVETCARNISVFLY